MTSPNLFCLVFRYIYTSNTTWSRNVWNNEKMRFKKRIRKYQQSYKAGDKKNS